MRCLRANETSQQIKTSHMRHTFMPGDETIKKNFFMQQFVKCNILIPSNQNGLLQYKKPVFDCYNIQSHLV